MKALILFSIALSSSLFAHDLEYGNYLKLQEALASDDFKSALAPWSTICKKELGHYAKDLNYKDCDKTMKNIRALRKSFKALSEIYIKNGETLKDGSIIVANCSMANGRWLQKAGPLMNPYYGAQMLHCGEIEKK